MIKQFFKCPWQQTTRSLKTTIMKHNKCKNKLNKSKMYQYMFNNLFFNTFNLFTIKLSVNQYDIS